MPSKSNGAGGAIAKVGPAFAPPSDVDTLAERSNDMPSKSNGGGGAIAKVGPEIDLHDILNLQLAQVLQSEKAEMEDFNWQQVPEAREAAFTWLHLYHGLVYMAAATGKAAAEYIDTAYDGPAWKFRYWVPGFSIGGDGEHGWFYPDTAKVETATAGLKGQYLQTLMTANGLSEDTLTHNLAQHTELDDRTAPLLQHFLRKLQTYAPPVDQADNIQANWRTLCQESLPVLDKQNPDNDQTYVFLQKALDHFVYLWGDDLATKVNTTAEWLPLADLDNAAFEAKLADLFPLAQAKTIIRTGSPQAKAQLSALADMLKAVNRPTYRFVYKRITGEPDNGISHCLDNAVANIVNTLSDDAQKQAWHYLLYATCSAITWRVGQQLNRVNEMMG